VSSKVHTILIVDDESILRDILAVWLSRLESVRVLTAEDGLAALEVLNTEPIDLVATDLRMPRMDGVSLVRELAKRPALQRIVVSSAQAQMDERELYALGVEAFMAKPLDEDTFFGTITRALMPREELWRVEQPDQPRQAIRRVASLQSDEVCLGWGGFCARYEGRPPAGEIQFDCTLPGKQVLRGSGLVRWSDRKEHLVGVEFTYLEEASWEQAVTEIARRKPRSFIPATSLESD
jgi:CheY-like chemotaxis protein